MINLHIFFAIVFYNNLMKNENFKIKIAKQKRMLQNTL